MWASSSLVAAVLVVSSSWLAPAAGCARRFGSGGGEKMLDVMRHFCRDDMDCQDLEDKKTCNIEISRCVQCENDVECRGGGLSMVCEMGMCVPGPGEGSACITPMDCGGEQSCFRGRCNALLQCTFRGHCPASWPRCMGRSCRRNGHLFPRPPMLHPIVPMPLPMPMPMPMPG